MVVHIDTDIPVPKLGVFSTFEVTFGQTERRRGVTLAIVPLSSGGSKVSWEGGGDWGTSCALRQQKSALKIFRLRGFLGEDLLTWPEESRVHEEQSDTDTLLYPHPTAHTHKTSKQDNTTCNRKAV